jgi:hypothetical protein
VHEAILEFLQVSWLILAAGLVFGIIYSIVRIIPRHEE